MADIVVIGLGKMGLSHLAIANALSSLRVVAICDASALVGGALSKVTGLRHIADYRQALQLSGLNGAIVATPTASHETIVRDALARGLDVFCEKPLTLAPEASWELAALAEREGLVTQVGYHNRFVGTFREMKALLAAGVLGRVSHVVAEAYGPVVTRPAKATWRSKSSEGGGALLDYAAHPLNLLNWYFGAPEACDSATLKSGFSAGVEDEVYAALRFAGGVTAQLSVNWSDLSQRKMTTQISVWGEHGRLYADRQELRLFLSDRAPLPAGYGRGWNVRYTTSLTEPVSFYLRGEEYSAQLETFASRIAARDLAGANSFADSAITDDTIAQIRAAAAGSGTARREAAPADRRGLMARVLGR